ncbi:transporter substrate-binding domain-containing protein [bacterium]|nr:transporter substrate-binding domain-containing protein [bacterium]
MKRKLYGKVLACAFTVAASSWGRGGAADPQIVERITKPSVADLDAMRKTRVLRVLVSHSRTNFFIEAGRARGFECEQFLGVEKLLNRNTSEKALAMHVVFVPVPFDLLLPALVEGRGDVAAAGLTITAAREKHVDFTTPYHTGVDEIVVTSKGVKPLKTLDDLAGRRVAVAHASSYAQHLAQLSQALVKKGKAPIEMVPLENHIETEDLLEMVNAGILEITVADRHIAELWTSVFKDMTLRRDLKVHTGGRIAWAVRKSNPKLRAFLNEYVAKNRKGTAMGNILFKRYYENTKWVKNPTTPAERAKMERYIALFKKYAAQYDFDWLYLGAQAYQESGLNPNAKSSVGAVGIMQLLPSTAKDMGIANFRTVEGNIHAGAKYMAWLRKHYFNAPGISAEAKFDFSLAGYNAGAGRVQKWRKKAPSLGIDPNRWFGHVERIALREVGQETVRYVSNINKYALAYTLAYKIRMEKKEAR